MLFRKPLQDAVLASVLLSATAPVLATMTGLEPIGRYAHGVEGGSEIVAYDKTTKRLFVVNAENKRIDVLNITNPASPSSVGSIDATNVTGLTGGAPNSVAVHKGLVAIAIEAATKQDNGVVAFFNASDLTEQKIIEAGALPDMVIFSPDGKKLLVANEGEPNDDYDNDPEGSVTIIDLSGGLDNAAVTTAGFTGFNADKAALIANGVRIFGPNATVAQDLEPEYITISDSSSTAWVGLQENNAIAKIDIASATVTDIYPLGFKDHSLPGNGFDASDKDDTVNIQPHAVLGMYQPDSIASFTSNGKFYLVTANEGDARDYDGFSEEYRVKDFNALDVTRYPAAGNFQDNTKLGRLKTTSTLGADLISTPGCDPADKDSVKDVCEYDQIYSYGARSMSVWDLAAMGSRGNQPVYDSGDLIEQTVATVFPDLFNANDDENAEKRSDDKGPEPEAATVAKLKGKPYAFIGLERTGGVMVFDLSNPSSPSLVTFENLRSLTTDLDSGATQLPAGPASVTLSTTDPGDLGPEGIIFIEPADSPSGEPLLVVANEVSGTTTIYNVKYVNQAPSFFTEPLLTVCKNAGGQSIQWAKNVTDGDFNAQALSYQLSNDKPDLFGGLLGFGGQPFIEPNGLLKFRPALNAHGTANVTVRLKDSGGIENGGQDTSTSRSFKIVIDSACDDGAGEIFNPGQFDFSYQLHLDDIGDIPLGVINGEGLISNLFTFTITNNGVVPANNAVLNLRLKNHDLVLNADERCEGDPQSGEYQCHFDTQPESDTIFEFQVRSSGNITAEAEVLPPENTAVSGDRLNAGNSGGGVFGWLSFLLMSSMLLIRRKKR